MNDELDHLLGALRGPATSDELAGESADVDHMCHAHESKGPTMFTSRRTRVATLVAAGVLGFGSVAAAGPAAVQMLTNDTEQQSPAPEDDEDAVEQPEDEVVEDTEEEVVEETEETEEEVVEETEETEEKVVEETEAVEVPDVVDEDPAPMPLLLDDPATTFFDESQCEPGNHGKTVSAVARGELEYYARDETGQKIGDPIDVEVRDAARSSCGKDFEGVDPEEDIDLEEDLEVEKLEVEEIDEPERKGKPDHAGGKDKGKPDHAGGKDKGKGKGKSGRG